MVKAMGIQKLRDGYGRRFYVAVLKDANGSRYSLRRFENSAEALVWGHRLEMRYRRMVRWLTTEYAENAEKTY